jgi:hypothetical protein
MRKLLRCLLAATLQATAGTAHAAWYQAQSKHFVIYADDNPKSLRDFATRLERFDAGVRIADHMQDPVIGTGNRLTVFVMPKAADVQALAGDKSGFLGGFYTGRVTGSLAYIGKDAGAYGGEKDEAIFFHEYTHHLMMQDFDQPYPEWYVEGFAEFFSTPKFDRDGSVWFGLPAQHRAWGLFNGPKMPVETLFAGMQPSMSKEQRDVFYGRGWLLAHYLLLGQKRDGQLAKYIAALANGTSSAEAARMAFGDLAQLDRELDSYRSKPLLEFKIGSSKIQLAAVEVTPLSPGAAQVILARAKIKYPLSQPAEQLAQQVRAIEARFPGDELVEQTLAEAELNAGHAEAAEAAADRSLKSEPQNGEAMVLKARALIGRAKAASDREAARALVEQARTLLIAANKLDTEDPEPLFEFYESFAREGVRPTDNAIAALHYASDLAPQDVNVRMNSAIAYLNEGKFPEARSTLAVVAYSPHSGSAGEMAKRMIADLDAGKGKATLEELRAASTAQPSSQ